MDKIKLDDSLRTVFGELQEYIDLQFKYNKILFAKKLGETLSYLALFMLILMIAGFLLLFLSFAFAEWFNEQFGLPYAGHLIVAGFYLLLAIIIIVFRKQMIFNPMKKLFGVIVLGDGENDQVYEEMFRAPGSVDVQLRNYREQIKKKGGELGKHFENLSEQLTISNIFQTVVRNAYTSYVTTSNVVKAAYSLVKRITSKKKHKLKKRKKNSYPEDDDDR